ncbi:MAG: hypothetical protein JSS49_21740 [Planctomycetes bacterium]|nr:hypothetical protein [Planctomycetota bacterium]
MSFHRELYTFTHVLFMTGAIALTMTGMYAARHQHGSIRELSRMDAKSACLTLNKRIATNLAQMA